MKDIIEWLRKKEKMAGKVYLLGAEIYADDPEFKKFLEDAAEEEAWHYHVMGSAAEYLVSRPAPIPAISIDETTSGKILKLNSRFLYITGYLSKEKRAFFSENRVKYLEKPMQIKVLREESSKIILSK